MSFSETDNPVELEGVADELLTKLKLIEKDHNQSINKFQSEIKSYEIQIQSFQMTHNKILQSFGDEINNFKKVYQLFEQEKKLIQSIHYEDPITLNVGGHHYSTSLNTLTKYNDCLLAKMFSGTFSVKQSKDGSYFIDRDGKNFSYILNYLRNDEIILPKNSDVIIIELLKEAEFYKLTNLVNKIKMYEKEQENNIKEYQQKQERELEEKIKIYQQTQEKELQEKMRLYQKEFEEKIKIYEKKFEEEKKLDCINSIILNQKENDLLLEWIPFGKSKKWSLLFRASRDGYTAKAFHLACDNKAPTIVIVHSNNGNVFGGYTPIPWDSTSGWKAEPLRQTFVFLLRSKNGDQPCTIKLSPTNNSYHIFCSGNYGPGHLGGVGIYIYDNCSTTNSTTLLSSSYADYSGSPYKLNGGTKDFTIVDYEVFTLE